MKILIDPGHVGIGTDDLRILNNQDKTLHEGEYCFHWARTLQEVLESQGHEVQLTRKQSQRCAVPQLKELNQRKSELKSIHHSEELAIEKQFGIPLSIQSLSNNLFETLIVNEWDLKQRAEMANHDYDLLLSLHLNGDPAWVISEMNGICGFCNEHADPALSSRIITSLAKNLGLPLFSYPNLQEASHGVYKRDLCLLRHSLIPTLLIEGPFQTHSRYFELFVQECQEGKGEIMKQMSDSIAKELPESLKA